MKRFSGGIRLKLIEYDSQNNTNYTRSLYTYIISSKNMTESVCTFTLAPSVGPISQLKERALGFKQGLLFQLVHPIASSLDWKGMLEGGVNHTKIFRKVLECMESPLKRMELTSWPW